MAKDKPEEKKEKISNVWRMRYLDPDTSEEKTKVGLGSNINIAVSKARKKVKAASKKVKDEQFVVEVLGMDFLYKVEF